MSQGVSFFFGTGQADTTNHGTQNPADPEMEKKQVPESMRPKSLEPSNYLETIGTYKPKFPQAGHYEVCQKRIRAWKDGMMLLDTERAIHVWENTFFPTIYVPKSSLFDREGKGPPLKRCGDSDRNMHLIKFLFLHELADYVQADWGLVVKNKYIGDVIVIVEGRLKDYIRIPFKAVDEWREHEDVIHGFPRDPYKAMSVNQCSRAVEIQIGPDKFESDQAVILSQKGYPPRYYFNRDIFKLKLPSGQRLAAKDPRKNGKTFFCPYKGQAEKLNFHPRYFDMILHGKEYVNICWRFTHPPPEVLEIKDRFCFSNRMLKSISVDGTPLILETIPGDHGMSEEELAMFSYDV
ncbi:hypothetical protein TWF281_001061 [Arthrobotrys megalospora]